MKRIRSSLMRVSILLFVFWKSFCRYFIIRFSCFSFFRYVFMYVMYCFEFRNVCSYLDGFLFFRMVRRWFSAFRVFTMYFISFWLVRFRAVFDRSGRIFLYGGRLFWGFFVVGFFSCFLFS